MQINMISYNVYKLIHLAGIFVFLTTGAILLVGRFKSLPLKIVTGLASFVVLFGGMGLMARLGVGFQPWVVAKLIIWLGLTGVSHMVAKRFPKLGMATYIGMVCLASVAAYIAIFKPNF
jgi:hypothetical protein